MEHSQRLVARGSVEGVSSLEVVIWLRIKPGVWFGGFS